MDPQARAHTDKAVALLKAGKLPHAAAEFEHASRLAPTDVTLRQRLGDVYLRLGLRTHAVHEFQQVAGRYAADGELLKAIAICKVILEIDPEHEETLHTLADLYAAQHERPPLAQKLPASMSGAVSGEKDLAPLDMESLAIFRDALEVLEEPAGEDEEEATAVQAPGTASIDLAKLPRSPLFSALDKAAFEALVKKLELRWVAAGETLVTEGEPGDSMFVVVQGVVNVKHGESVLAVMADGAFFGEMALLTDSPRLASVVAARDGLLFEIHRSQLEELAAAHPGIGKVVATFYQDRLLANVLRASPVFRPLSDAERTTVGTRFVRHSLPPQTVLLEQGKPGAGFCVLLRGKCEVFHTGGRGDELKLSQLKEGDVFGEISLLLESPCTATVRTLSFCEILELPRDDFRSLVLPNPEIKAMVQKLMAERLDHTAEVLERAGAILPDYVV